MEGGKEGRGEREGDMEEVNRREGGRERDLSRRVKLSVSFNDLSALIASGLPGQAGCLRLCHMLWCQ